MNRNEQSALAVVITEKVWASRKQDVLRYLIKERPGAKFSQAGAEKAFKSFVESMAFVADQTGKPQLGGHH